MKGADNRNFEAGILTNDPELVEAIIAGLAKRLTLSGLTSKSISTASGTINAP